MSLWGGRFTEPPNELLRKLNDSIDFDQRMYAEDILGSQAYARALVGAGILTPEEADTIVSGLDQVKAEFDDSRFVFAEGDEDIHTAVERRLTEIVGEVGKKLHTGRSRNDQVATDFRLWVLKAIDHLDDLLLRMQTALIEKAEAHIQTLMPGYTHFQPAQPITAAHWLMSFFWMLDRDRARLADARGRTSVMPLGSGALAGTPLKIDRIKLASELKFFSYSHNSLDAVSDRDFIAETIFCSTMINIHISRLAEDIIIYSNPALNFITLDDRYSTGSSLMPQKRNADPMELARGKAGRLIGNLSGILSTLKGLPSGYNKDLQEDKEVTFDTFNTLNSLLPVITAIVHTLQINKDATENALNDELLATDLADYLVNKGLPFREAHHVVGQVVEKCQRENIALSQLPLTELQSISELFAEDVQDVFDFQASVDKRSSLGGTGTSAVKLQIQEAKRRLE